MVFHHFRGSQGTCLSKGTGSAFKCKNVVPSMLQIAQSVEIVAMLPALIHQLDNNFTATKSIVLHPFEQLRARHVVFGRACGAALTTPST